MFLFPHAYGETILKINNVSKSFGDTVVLKDVNVEIKDITRPGVVQGQIVGFLGPSGIGKSQLFNIMSGLVQPTSGEVLIGKDLQPVKVGNVGVVQQNYPLFAHRTVFKNLRLAAQKGATPEKDIDAKIHHYLDRFRMSEHVNKFPAQLSGGQRQRIAIAQQLLCSEHFLLLDEPFSGLDVLMVEEVSEMLVEISNMDEYNTIIIVSHDIVSTAAIADTLWLMGRDRDAQNNPIPGAKIKYSYNLVENGLAWQKNIETTPEFINLVADVKQRYATL